MKKIVILNGAPRKDGNTAALVRAFVRGAEKAGNEVTEFYLQGMDIRPCLGCCGGGKDKSSPCVQKDDMERIYPAVDSADVLVLASPLYYWQMSGLLKTAIDRCFAMSEAGLNWRGNGRRTVLLMTAMGDAFEYTQSYFRSLVTHMGWKNGGQIVIGGLMEKDSLAGMSEELAKAEELGFTV
ncbi:MAG: flavodoxin family protein [Lachnospiraceae bacterium]|nr:flavodoxin family protein [Lachnospiraceae bacterium]